MFNNTKALERVGNTLSLISLPNQAIKSTSVTILIKVFSMKFLNWKGDGKTGKVHEISDSVMAVSFNTDDNEVDAGFTLVYVSRNSSCGDQLFLDNDGMLER